MKKQIITMLTTAQIMACCTGCGDKTDSAISSEIKRTDCDIMIEAEDCNLNENILLENRVEGYSGEGYISIRVNEAFLLTVILPASQHYTITVRHCADSFKENPLLINGSKVMSIISEDAQWAVSTVENVFLEAGENQITLGEGWSWFNIDYIRFEDGTQLSDTLYENVAKTLSNGNANKKTQNIYQYLRSIYGKKTIIGQCTAYGEHTEFDMFYHAFGKYPALRTFDFLYDSYATCNGKPPAKDVKEAIEWSKQGGLVVFDWHWNDPYKNSFYSSNTDFILNNAVTKEEIACLTTDEIDAMYEEGKIAEETKLIIRDMDLIAGLIGQMQNEDVTILWRPLHEAEGAWFWWGSSGPDAYQWLWKLMYERMTYYHMLNNLIWVWNGAKPEWYPSDEYCDIATIDIYNEAQDNNAGTYAMSDYNKWLKGKKMLAIAECATMPDPEFMVRDNAHWLWFSTWIGDYVMDSVTKEISGEYTSLELMRKIFDSDIMITLDELPDWGEDN